MKRRIKLTPILIALILSFSASLTSCNDSETGTDSASVTVSQTEKETNTQAVTDAEVETDSVTSEAPTDDIVSKTPAEDTEVPETNATTAPETEAPETKPAVTTAPETQAPETKPPVTTSPETTAPVDTQPIADPEKFPSDWGDAYENNAIRTDYKYIVWTKTRHLVEVPKAIGEDWFCDIVDEKNEQMLISTGSLREGTSVRYALVNGVFYKLSEKKIISVTIHNKKFAWIEEDGTVYSINIRTKWFNEVYVEASGAAGMFFRNNELLIANQEGELIERNEKDILRDVKKVSN